MCLSLEDRMKASIVLIVAAALVVARAEAQTDSSSCAPPTAKNVSHADGRHENPATRPASDAGNMVNDVRIELALFGSGTHLADVTDRVVQLLRTQPQGFTARSDSLHIDPLPGKNKSLLIRYRYQDQERLFLITGGNRASYALLVEGDEDKSASAR
jgi:hypothetical protein